MAVIGHGIGRVGARVCVWRSNVFDNCVRGTLTQVAACHTSNR